MKWFDYLYEQIILVLRWHRGWVIGAVVVGAVIGLTIRYLTIGTIM